MAKRKANPDSEAGPSLEDAMTELGGIVSSLESGQASLDESLAQFERGMSLLRVCHQKLDAAAQRIEIVTQLDSDGTVETEDFDATSTLQKSSSPPADSPSPPTASRPSRKSPRETNADEDDSGLLF